MTKIYLMVLRSFIPLFLVAMLFFVLILQIMDLFGNISRYISHGVPALEVARIALLYLPKCIAFSIPVAFMFGISFTLGIFYTNNELLAIFDSGISLYRLVLPFILIGFFLSAGGFFFEDYLVIPSLRARNTAYAAAVKLASASSQPNVTVISGSDEVIYQADYFNDALKRLDGVTLVVRRPDGVLDRRIDAQWGEWRENHWVFHACRIFVWNEGRGELTDFTQDVLDSPQFAEPPDTFKRPTRSVTEMTSYEAVAYVATLKRTGFSDLEAQALTDYYRKYSFAFTPLIVALIASSLGSTFRKNILLMSLLMVLVISVVYYVAQMVAATLSKFGHIPPLAAAWIPFTLFLMLGAMLFRTART
jgi:lipopolysaccharide export system permease protein